MSALVPGGTDTGSSTFTIKTGNWDLLGAGAARIRQAVFMVEQGISSELEWDGLDADAVHALIESASGEPIATGRLLRADAAGHDAMDPTGPKSPICCRIGRVAVRLEDRGGGPLAGHGAAVMRALEEVARSRGDNCVALHAQLRAQSFYARLGYAAVGGAFDEAGIAHVEMRKSLFATVNSQ